LSASLNLETDWNFRKTDQRLIVIKTKNANIHKVAALDVLTNLSFTMDISESTPLGDLQLEKEYLAQLRVYTLKSLEGIDKEFFNFFNTTDVDQAMEDFIKAYWVYPDKIRFELVEFEEA
jgi:hypothetical protein